MTTKPTWVRAWRRATTGLAERIEVLEATANMLIMYRMKERRKLGFESAGWGANDGITAALMAFVLRRVSVCRVRCPSCQAFRMSWFFTPT